MKNGSIKEDGKPTVAAHPSNVFTMSQQQGVLMMVNSRSTTNEKQLDKGFNSKVKASFGGTSSYILSQSTYASTGAAIPTDCAPSREMPSTYAKKSIESTPTQEADHQILYLSKPQSNDQDRPVFSEEVMDFDRQFLNSNQANEFILGNNDDLEASYKTSEVYVEAEVARDMDSVVNQAVSEALRERDRNIVNAVHVELAPSPAEDDTIDNKTDFQNRSGNKETRQTTRQKLLICFGIGFLAIVVAVVAILQTSASGSAGNSNLVLVHNDTSTPGDDSATPKPTPPSSSPSKSAVTLPMVTETKFFPLGLCTGDCDTDLDCRQGLVCFQRNEFEAVPQCSGGEYDSSLTDYCIAADPTASPSAAPTGPTLSPSLSPSFSPTPKPTQDQLRLDDIIASLGDYFFPYHTQALEWILQNDTWVPSFNATDPSGLWRERYAFATLFFDTNGPFWEVKGRWLSEESVCRWNSGIRCNTDGKVDYVYISDWSHIVGSIPSELKALTMLSHLDFSSHELGGSFPSEIGTLSLLTRLDLRSNELSGTIPTEIGMLTKLEGLYLRQNNLVGGLPSEIGRLINLQYTFLDENLISGPIPTEIGRMTSLRDITAFNNRFNGPIPSEIGLLTNMEGLLLYDNELTGSIISEIGLLTNMKWLSLYDNSLVGNIPSEIGMLTNMWRLHLSDNRLTGTVPDDFGLLFLEYLNIARNQLTGVFPVMTFDSSDSEPRCFMESNRFDDTSKAPSFCRI